MATLNKILSLLKEQHKTQKELMEYLGLGKTAFTGWKSGKNTSYLKKLPEIADFFGVSVNYLLDRTNVRLDKKENLSAKTDEEILDEELINLFYALSPQERALVLAFAKGLLANRE